MCGSAVDNTTASVSPWWLLSVSLCVCVLVLVLVLVISSVPDSLFDFLNSERKGEKERERAISLLSSSSSSSAVPVCSRVFFACVHCTLHALLCHCHLFLRCI